MAVFMPHAGCLLPHELSAISTPLCLQRPFIRARNGVELGQTVIFRAVKTDSRKLQDQQMGTGFDVVSARREQTEVIDDSIVS